MRRVVSRVYTRRVHYAACECGWVGKYRDTEHGACEDKRRHNEGCHEYEDSQSTDKER